MKKIILLFAVFASLSSYARGGGTVGNGGDAYVMDFIATGERIVKWLEVESINDLSGLSAASFSKALKSAKISSSEASLLLEGIEKDAINNPITGEIVLSRGRWKNIANDFQRIGIVIHEILGLMNINDLSYKVSIPLASRITGVDLKKTPFFKTSFTCDSYAVAKKSNGTMLRDIQRVIVGFNPSAIGIQGLTHTIDGHTYYMGVHAGAGKGMDVRNLDSEYWKVEYYLASSPMTPALEFKVLGTSSFYAFESELPPKFSLPFGQVFWPDVTTEVSFNLFCQLN